MDFSTPRLIDLPEVTRLTALRKTSIYERVNAGEFHIIKLGRKSVFNEREILEWVEKKIEGINAQAGAD